MWLILWLLGGDDVFGRDECRTFSVCCLSVHFRIASIARRGHPQDPPGLLRNHLSMSNRTFWIVLVIMFLLA